MFCTLFGACSSKIRAGLSTASLIAKKRLVSVYDISLFFAPGNPICFLKSRKVYAKEGEGNAGQNPGKKNERK